MGQLHAQLRVQIRFNPACAGIRIRVFFFYLLKQIIVLADVQRAADSLQEEPDMRDKPAVIN